MNYWIWRTPNIKRNWKRVKLEIQLRYNYFYFLFLINDGSSLIVKLKLFFSVCFDYVKGTGCLEQSTKLNWIRLVYLGELPWGEGRVVIQEKESTGSSELPPEGKLWTLKRFGISPSPCVIVEGDGLIFILFICGFIMLPHCLYYSPSFGWLYEETFQELL